MTTLIILNTGHIHRYIHVIVPRFLSTIPALQMCTSTILALKCNVQAALRFLYYIFVLVFTDTRKILDNSIEVMITIFRSYTQIFV